MPQARRCCGVDGGVGVIEQGGPISLRAPLVKRGSRFYIDTRRFSKRRIECCTFARSPTPYRITSAAVATSPQPPPIRPPFHGSHFRSLCVLGQAEVICLSRSWVLTFSLSFLPFSILLVFRPFLDLSLPVGLHRLALSFAVACPLCQFPSYFSFGAFCRLAAHKSGL